MLRRVQREIGVVQDHDLFLLCDRRIRSVVAQRLLNLSDAVLNALRDCQTAALWERLQVIVENENDVVEFLLYLHGMFQLVGGTDSYRSVEYASGHLAFCEDFTGASLNCTHYTNLGPTMKTTMLLRTPRVTGVTQWFM